MTRTALLLDVDGTLVDIAPTPADVVVPPALLRVLGELTARADGAVALVSGRTVETIDRLFAPLVTPAIGGHGAEMRIADGAAILQRPFLLNDALKEKLHRLAEADPRILVEDKSHSIALHYRLAPEHEALLKGGVSEIVADDDDIEVLVGKSVIDIKSKLFSKGAAVMELMTCEPFAGRTPIFIGDDTTDESVFAVLPEFDGIGYSVGRSIEGASGTFGSPRDVRDWLTEISRQSGSRA
jgi:trehalose 6-phosphate phosphatase